MQEPLYAVVNPFRMSPVVGSTYTVVWDGVSYDVKMRDFDGFGYIGNVNYVNMASGGNIPFAIVFAGDVFLVTESPAASHTISISRAVVHKLDSKYLDLPTNLATTDDVQEAVDVANEAHNIANEAHNIANSNMKANNPVGTGSFSMNRKSGTTIGDKSFAEGCGTTASGKYSHAEGSFTTASGDDSHAEGAGTTASGDDSHAEGRYATASGYYSHAEGCYVTASGYCSHAEGYSTKASGSYSHAEGKFNISDTTNTHAHIVGNGASDTKRSNAHTLDWEGNAWYQGDVYVGSTSGTNKDEGSKKLATEEYVDTALENIQLPEGGSSEKWRKIASITLEEELATFKITEDENGNPFNLKKLMVIGVLLPCADVTNNYAVKMATDSDTTNIWSSSSGQICSSPKNTETRRSFISMREVICDGLIYNESQVSYNAGSISDSTGYNGVGQTAPVNIVRLDGEQLALGDQKKIDCVWIGSYTLCLGIGSRFEIFGVDS